MSKKQSLNILLISCLIMLFMVFATSAESKALDSRLLIQFNKLRKVTRCNFRVSSGHRTRSHNRSVGGVPKSYHIKGMALDLQPVKPCKLSLKRIGLHAMKLFNGVILYSTHIHVDVGSRIYNNLGVL